MKRADIRWAVAITTCSVCLLVWSCSGIRFFDISGQYCQGSAANWNTCNWSDGGVDFTITASSETAESLRIFLDIASERTDTLTYDASKVGLQFDNSEISPQTTFVNNKIAAATMSIHISPGSTKLSFKFEVPVALRNRQLLLKMGELTGGSDAAVVLIGEFKVDTGRYKTMRV